MRSRVLLPLPLVWRSLTFSLQKNDNTWSQSRYCPLLVLKTTLQRHLKGFITITFVYYLCSRLFQMSAWAPERLLVPVHFFARSRTGNERVKIKNKMADERRVLSLFVIDAFTSKPFSGNPAAVCIVGSKVSFILLSWRMRGRLERG